ncbi:MAG: hypothetical protein E7054_06240 [Lentisphaerae bacterium]|nr:hypothetical protein [Lentisphaerota bacterium]
MKKFFTLFLLLNAVTALYAAPALYSEKFELPLKRSWWISSTGEAAWNYDQLHEVCGKRLRIRFAGDTSRLAEIKVFQAEKAVFSLNKFNKNHPLMLPAPGTYRFTAKGNPGAKAGHAIFDTINAQGTKMLSWTIVDVNAAKNADGNTTITPIGKKGSIYARYSGLTAGQWYKVDIRCSASKDTAVIVSCSQRVGKKRPRVERKVTVTPGTEQTISCEFLAESSSVSIAIGTVGTLELKSLHLDKQTPPAAEKTRKIGSRTVVFEPRNPLPEPKRIFSFPVAFKRPPRKIYQESIPQPFEEIKSVETFSTPGDYAVWHFAVHNTVDTTGNIKITDLKHGKNIIPAAAVKLSFVEFHDYPMGTSNYTNMPEKILELTASTPRASGNRIFWLQTRLAKNCTPGLYTGKIEVDCGKNKLFMPLKLKVLPFTLPTPENMSWSMYSGIHYGQRRHYPLESKVAYLKDMRDYGITGLHHHLSGGDEDNIAHIQKLRKLAKMDGPLIIYGSMSEMKAAKKLGITLKKDDPWFENPAICAGFTQRLKDIDHWVKKHGGDNYNNWYFMGHDEPHLRPQLFKSAIAQHKLAKAAGFKSISNVYAPNYVDAMSEVIDISSNIFIGDNADTCSKLAAIGKKRNIKYWYLGGGCYNGQEGGLMPNRLQAGFLSFKLGVTGHLSYTYQIGDYPVDHFKSGKVYLMTYPSAAKPAPGQCPSIFTLMYEGIREGITDYKYMYALKCAIERARKNGNISGADEAQKTMQAILDRIPFLDQVNNGKDGLLQKKNFDNDTADQLRRAAAAAILKLEGKEF